MNADCGHYDKEMKNCAVLNRKDCRNCTFYATKGQLRAKKEAAGKLLRAKPPEEQSRIADKYYNGRMPWAATRKVVTDDE